MPHVSTIVERPAALMALVLPLVLIGPILRRVEPRFIAVFVATKSPASIHISVYEGVVNATTPPAEYGSADAQTTAFGAQFHATVVTVNFADTGALMPGHRYSYDVRITPSGGVAQSLLDLKLLEDGTMPGYGPPPPDPPPPPTPQDLTNPAQYPNEVCAISYADGQLPSFVTCPATLDELVFAHASCRKPHGPGEPALKFVDDLIDDLHGADAGHPHMLFLTGDQIYADDVAAALLPGLNLLASALISGDSSAAIEQIPSPAGDRNLNVTNAVLPAGFRQKLTGATGFTSESSACHLLGFGEWLAMYCIAWNPLLWPVLAVADFSSAAFPDGEFKTRLQKDTTLSPADAPRALGAPSSNAATDVISPLYGDTPEAKDALKAAFSSFLDDKATLDAYRREVPKVRRLLANVPSYMICDDHEVTDDWFMTGAIRSNTTGKPFGRAVLRNAICAYTVCQAWGNDPVRWAADPKRQGLLTGIAGMFGSGWSGGPGVSSACDAVDLALGLSPTGQPQFDFSFAIDYPMHRVRVLDTRTRREYLTPFAPPGLLTQQALDDQLPPTDTLPDGHVLVVVSPAPVFGPPIMTEVLGPLGASAYDIATFARERSEEQNLTGLPNGRPLGTQFLDAEHWGVQPAAFERLLARLSQFKRVVVLGGDVHYGGAFAMDWSGSGRNSRIIHFTSSAARNAWMDVVRNLMLLNGMSIGLQRIGMPMTRLGWSATLPPVVTDIGTEPPLAQIRVQTGPVLLSNDLFRAAHPLQRPPEWLWRSTPIFDTRAPADRPVAARATGLSATDLPAGKDALQQYGDLVAAHVSALDTVAIARGLQFLNNVGVIRFTSASDGLHVSQSLYSLRARPQPNEKGDAYIVHEAQLEPVAVPVPTSVGPGA